MTFFAHSTDNPDQSDWQTLASHLSAAGAMAAERAMVFGGAEYGRAAGLLHDLGKYTEEFQKRLKHEFPRVDHSTWGARIACERYGAPGKLLAYGVAGHHAGLANGRDTGKRRCLMARLKAELPALLPEWQREIKLPPIDALQLPDGFTPRRERHQFQLAFLARMIFSCLVDADFVDTEAFYKSVSGERNFRNGEYPGLTELRKALDRYLSRFIPNTPVNQHRAEILHHVRANVEWETGLFSLTVPTGGGKTLASLSFALDHAIRHGLRRVIYVIPFTSIVEQTAGVFRRAFGELGIQAVLEHHSAFIDDQEFKDHRTAPQSRQKLALAMENWDAPVVVTTAVQFFESLFADRPSRCRKLHNIAGSVVILDEAQVLPLKLLRPCVVALDELASNYRASVVLCTATQPALRAPDFAGGFDNVRELAPEPERVFPAFERVRLRHLGDMNDDALLEEMAARDQVLCIVNNRRHARALYEAMDGLAGAAHLTTLMCAKHRSQVLDGVRRRLEANKPCRLVATSLIEAGVDVDFPRVLRAEAGLDSVAQAAGRCNREGRRPAESSEVLIFNPDNEQWSPPPELVQYAQAAREVWRRHPNEPLSLAAIDRYFTLLYWQRGHEELDAHDLLSRFEEGGLDGMPFETVAAKFRMIESAQLPVIIPSGQHDPEGRVQQILQQLSFANNAGGIARKLQPYVVQLPRHGYDALYKAGAIQPAFGEQFGEQFMVLVNESLYDRHVGLDWDNPMFVEAERSVL